MTAAEGTNGRPAARVEINQEREAKERDAGDAAGEIVERMIHDTDVEAQTSVFAD